MESQGFTDIAVKLYAITQLRAISIGGDEKITPALIQEVAKDCLSLVRPMLEALKSGDLAEIAKYGDISPLKYDEFYEQYSGKLTRRVGGQRKIQAITPMNNKSIATQVITELLRLGISPEVAVKAAEEAITSLKTENVSSLVMEAFKNALGVTDERTKIVKPKNKKESTIREVTDLRFIEQQAKANHQPVYELLKENGYIKNIVEEFL